jgi:pantetheine-phosphate adenylyltransferase
MLKLAIYAGTFDPLTLGHLDLIDRSAEIFEDLIIAVADSTPKETLFDTDERMEMVEEVVQGYKNVKVEKFGGLLIEYARQKSSKLLVRGLRAYSDFEYEFQMALTNRKMAPEIETFFMMPKEIHSYISSSAVRQVATLGGDTSEFVPASVQERLVLKLNR